MYAFVNFNYQVQCISFKLKSASHVSIKDDGDMVRSKHVAVQYFCC